MQPKHNAITLVTRLRTTNASIISDTSGMLAKSVSGIQFITLLSLHPTFILALNALIVKLFQ